MLPTAPHLGPGVGADGDGCCPARTALASSTLGFIPNSAGIYPWENKLQGARTQGAAGGVSQLNAMVTVLGSSFFMWWWREAKKAAAGWWSWVKEGSKSPSCSSRPQTQPGCSDICSVQQEGEGSKKYPGEPVAPKALFTFIRIKDTDQLSGFSRKPQ